MRGVSESRAMLFEEMCASVPEEETSTLETIDGYEYFTRAENDEELLKYCRRDAVSGETTVVLDPNRLLHESHGEGIAVGHVVMSHDHRYVAYCVDFTGGEDWTLRVKDVVEDRTLSNVRVAGVGHVEWAGSADPGVLYYTRRETDCQYLRRASTISRVDVLSDVVESQHLLRSDDRALFADVKKTKDGKFLLAYFTSKTKTKLYAFSMSQPSPSPVQLWPPNDDSDEDGLCFAEHNRGQWYMLTRRGDTSSEGGEDFSLRRVSHRSVERKEAVDDDVWETIVPPGERRCIEDMDMFESHCVLYERHEGLPTVRYFSVDDPDRTMTTIPLPIESPAAPRAIVPAPNASFASSVVRFECSSPVLPPTPCAYDVSQQDVPLHVDVTAEQHDGGSSFDERRENEEVVPWICYREHVPSSSSCDPVPLTLIRRSDVTKNGNNPLLLTGYGAYGVPLETSFCPARLSLVRRGWIVALAHVRGGGDLGARWHRDGCLLNKRQSFDDFADCAEWLVTENWTSSRRMTASASSAGALILGAVANDRPDLFAGMALDVPFLDVEREMTDASLPLTEHEYDEWGDCRDPAVLEYVRGWSPLSNVRSQPYPAMLVTTSLHDGRVGWSHAAKWVRAVQTHTTSDAPVLLKTTEDGTGHFGSGGRFQRYEAKAFEYSFLGRCVGAW